MYSPSSSTSISFGSRHLGGSRTGTRQDKIETLNNTEQHYVTWALLQGYPIIVPFQQYANFEALEIPPR